VSRERVLSDAGRAWVINLLREHGKHLREARAEFVENAAGAAKGEAMSKRTCVQCGRGVKGRYPPPGGLCRVCREPPASVGVGDAVPVDGAPFDAADIEGGEPLPVDKCSLAEALGIDVPGAEAAVPVTA